MMMKKKSFFHSSIDFAREEEEVEKEEEEEEEEEDKKKKTTTFYNHRSTSPNTMSRVPMMATASASMWPRDTLSIPAKWAKPGALILQRYGFEVPSDMR